MFKTEVRCDIEYAAYPVCALAELDESEKCSIRRLAAVARKHNLLTVQKLDKGPVWFNCDIDETAPLTKIETADVEDVRAVRLHVSGDEFWWTGTVRNTDIEITTVPVPVSELLPAACCSSGSGQSHKAKTKGDYS